MPEHEALKLMRQYWSKRQESHRIADVFGRRIIAAFMHKLQPKSLVEVGCGTGELFSAYAHVPYVVAVDWADHMVQRSLNRVQRHNYTNITVKQLDITSDYIHEKFDLALTKACLMHIPPENIKSACANLSHMSNQQLIMEYYEPERYLPISPHNWMHPYATIFADLGYQLVEAFDRPDGLEQILFHFKKVNTCEC